eukprot:TRINITY_DN6285_c0_g1_i1.p1 TRINITY_DN6285_c0_g1~~TRINITY_DN6285_c0_g1_i1.p1  ORF type:complete len:968 (+),score=274.45 TRINITY_DN6285_c0_g1_i1:33-2906(+)
MLRRQALLLQRGGAVWNPVLTVPHHRRCARCANLRENMRRQSAAAVCPSIPGSLWNGGAEGNSALRSQFRNVSSNIQDTETGSNIMAAETTSIKRHVLPTNVLPKHYNLKLDVNLEKFTFLGECRVDAEVNTATDEITVNAAELTFFGAVVVQEGVEHKISAEDIKLSDEDERVSFKLPAALKQGPVTITYNYEGILNDQMKGFYRSKYTVEEDGKKVEKYMATTQFEAADARRALPCWDEPLHKATFDVVLVIPESLMALSNMQETSEEKTDTGKRMVTYATTPKMSTYLLAFAVGEFDYIESTIKTVHHSKNNRIRVYATKGTDVSVKGKLAMEVAEKCLPMYEKFFGVDYPLPKCDLIAIPDFASGAMENWGLITYRETCMLCDESSSTRSRVFVALVVAHELAHQWFGNLVTMEWWKELWLNESFATYMEFDFVNQLFPEWQVWTQFVAEDYNSALTLDSLQNSHPVEVDVCHAQEIDEIFDDISYAKGCSLMRMAIAWIGEESFQKAMVQYMADHAYGNATTVDLWNSLEKQSGMPVREVMADWTKVQGYPVLTAELTDSGDVEITQNRFLSARLPSEEEAKQVWNIPIVMGTDKGPVKHLLKEKVSTVKMPEGAKWMKLNLNQTSLCRVQYKGKLLENLAEACKKGEVSNVDRTGIVGDMSALTTAGLMSAVDFLKFVKYFEDEEDVAVWSAIESGVSEIMHMTRSSEEGMKLMHAYCIKLFNKISTKLGWEPAAGDDDRTKQLRGTVQGMLACCGDETALKTARERFEKVRNGDKTVLTADMRAGVYRAVVRFGGKAEWEAVKEMHETAEEAVEKVRCLRSMGSTKDIALLKESIDYAVSDKTRNQDSSSLLAAVSINVKGTDLFREYFTSKWDFLFKKLGTVLISRLVGSVGDSVDRKDADAIEAWWKTVDEIQRKTADRNVAQAVENIHLYANFVERDQEKVIAYLKQ